MQYTTIFVFASSVGAESLLRTLIARTTVPVVDPQTGTVTVGFSTNARSGLVIVTL